MNSSEMKKEMANGMTSVNSSVQTASGDGQSTLSTLPTSTPKIQTMSNSSIDTNMSIASSCHSNINCNQTINLNLNNFGNIGNVGNVGNVGNIGNINRIDSNQSQLKSGLMNINSISTINTSCLQNENKKHENKNENVKNKKVIIILQNSNGMNNISPNVNLNVDLLSKLDVNRFGNSHILQSTRNLPNLSNINTNINTNTNTNTNTNINTNTNTNTNVNANCNSVVSLSQLLLNPNSNRNPPQLLLPGQISQTLENTYQKPRAQAQISTLQMTQAPQLPAPPLQAPQLRALLTQHHHQQQKHTFIPSITRIRTGTTSTNTTLPRGVSASRANHGFDSNLSTNPLQTGAISSNGTPVGKLYPNLFVAGANVNSNANVNATVSGNVNGNGNAIVIENVNNMYNNINNINNVNNGNNINNSSIPARLVSPNDLQLLVQLESPRKRRRISFLPH